MVMMPTPARSAKYCWLQLSKPLAALDWADVIIFPIIRDSVIFYKSGENLLTPIMINIIVCINIYRRTRR